MMKKVLLSLLLIGFAGMLYAQGDEFFTNGLAHSASKNYNPLSLNTSFVKTKPIEKYETKGSGYLHPEWRRGIIVVNRYKTPFMHNSIKLDLVHDMLEFNLGKDGLKVMDGTAFDTLYLENPQGGSQTFIRSEKLYLPGQFKGFSEVLYDGKFKIVKAYYSKVIPANYNVAMMVGTKYDELVVRSEIFVLEGGKAYELPKKKEDMLNMLSRYFPNTRQAYKQNKPMLKDEASLLAFIKLNLEPTQ